jgi:hypothetical protein
MARQPRIPGAEAAPEQPETQAPAEAAPEQDAKQLRAADVDPTKIRRAVLTLDGWVCPATSPAPPAKE